jgi:hypothetical protein
VALGVVLPQVLLTGKELRAVGAFHSLGGITFFRNLYQVLIGSKSLLLNLIFFFQIAKLGIVSLDFFTNFFGGLMRILVL